MSDSQARKPYDEFAEQLADHMADDFEAMLDAAGQQVLSNDLRPLNYELTEDTLDRLIEDEGDLNGG